ncbi:MAG TPA: hypothetical protein P5205_03080 [Candidatus Paceibacterota bacterium]|nr:hypothetical protein [Verrucomicrobiota bacterium]HSA09332.1 hypothetical protein [Candidatus Paceibacterota bacterium]
MPAVELRSKSDAARCQAALQSTLAFVEMVAPTRWLVRASRTTESSILARLVDGFLILTAQYTPAAPSAGWELLKANANLSGLAKFASAPGGGWCLRAEIPISAECDLPSRIAQACSAFAAAQGVPRAGQGSVGIIPSDGPPAELGRLVEAAGWKCSSQSGDVCSVALETRLGGHTAILNAPAGAVRICTDLALWDTLPVTCRDGLANMLVTANARLRLARAIVAEDESGGAAQLEVLFQAPAAPAELRSAFEALSVGADACASIADLLQEEAAAELFLTTSGGSQGREDNQKPKERTI